MISPGMEHGPPRLCRGRRRPENRLAHARRNRDCFSFVVGAHLGICVICEICGFFFWPVSAARIQFPVEPLRLNNLP